MKEIKKIAFLLLLLVFMFHLHCRLNTFRVDIAFNYYGLDPRNYVCVYDDIAKRVTCMPSMTGERPYVFHNVYVRRLTSDPKGINFIGSFPNPFANPGLVVEYTSTRPLFEVYASKY